MLVILFPEHCAGVPFRNAMQGRHRRWSRPLYAAQTEVATQFRELARKEGFAALKWRKAQFET